MKILSNEAAQCYQMTSLKRGHLIFASFISYNGKILFLRPHIERLVKGADFLFPNRGWQQNIEKIKEYVEKEFKEFSDRASNYYFRLNIFDDCIFLEKQIHEINSDSLKIKSAYKIKTPGLIPSFVKTSNYLEADLELAQAKLKDYDDILFFDNFESVTEATTSNIFIVTSFEEIITPAPSSIILDGVTRKKLFEKLKNEGFNIREASIFKSDLLKAQEIWLTNAVKGLRFVSQFEELCFDRKNSMYQKAIAHFGRYGERL